MFVSIPATELCEMENVKSFPTFKLYVGGRFLTKYNQSPNFINMRNFVENAPLENQINPAQVKRDIVYVEASTLRNLKQ